MFPLKSRNVPLGVHVPPFGNLSSNWTENVTNGFLLDKNLKLCMIRILIFDYKVKITLHRSFVAILRLN